MTTSMPDRRSEIALTLSREFAISSTEALQLVNAALDAEVGEAAIGLCLTMWDDFIQCSETKGEAFDISKHADVLRYVARRARKEAR